MWHGEEVKATRAPLGLSDADTGNHTQPTAPGFVLGIQGPEELRTDEISFKPRETFMQKKKKKKSTWTAERKCER